MAYKILVFVGLVTLVFKLPGTRNGILPFRVTDKVDLHDFIPHAVPLDLGDGGWMLRALQLEAELARVGAHARIEGVGADTELHRWLATTDEGGRVTARFAQLAGLGAAEFSAWLGGQVESLHDGRDAAGRRSIR